MSRVLRIFALILTTAATACAQEEFSRRLTPQERKAAGLDRLSREQLATLDALILRDRQGGAPAVAVTPSAAPAAVRPAPAPIAEPATPRAAQPTDEAKPEQKKRLFGLPARDEVAAITGTLSGEFRGWNGNTRFQLEDGQVWVQTDHADTREFTPQQNVRVKIAAAVFGDYKLTVEGSRIWVRVKRLE